MCAKFSFSAILRAFYHHKTWKWARVYEEKKEGNAILQCWSANPTNGREPDDFQPRAQIKRSFEESEVVSGDSEAIRKFSDKYIVPKNLVAEYVEHLAQIKMCKDKKKEETEREWMERLNRQYNDTDWAGLYNSDKLSSLRVDELSLYFSHHKITFKGKRAEKVAMIKAHIGSLPYNSMERQQLRQPQRRNVRQQATSSLPRSKLTRKVM